MKSGCVVLATHRASKVQYALKRIYISGVIPTNRWYQQLQARQEWGTINSIVTLHDFFSSGDEIYLVLEYMDWGSLDSLLKQQKSPDATRMEEGVVSIIIGSILHALDFLHSTPNLGQGRIHRAINPTNIVLSRCGAVKLCDFGFGPSPARSHAITPEDAKNMTYMSPERVLGESYTSNADLWSLGIIAVECALCRHPYEDIVDFDFIDRIQDSPAPDLTGSGLSDDLTSFIHRCLVKDQASRASAQELLQHPFITQHAYKGFGVVADWLARTAPPPR